jgi:hypothetical protein
MGGDRQGICLPAYGLRVLEKFARIDNGLQFTPDTALGLPMTPPQILGPFYPVSERPDLAGDLTRPSGQQGEAPGAASLRHGPGAHPLKTTGSESPHRDLAGQCGRQISASERYAFGAARSRFKGFARAPCHDDNSVFERIVPAARRIAIRAVS